LGNIKSYKTQFPTWPRGPPVSRSHCMPPCSLSFLLSANKIFLTSAVQVCLWFPCKSRTRTLTTQTPLCITMTKKVLQSPFLRRKNWHTERVSHSATWLVEAGLGLKAR
jgi:hypothetical protein